MSNVKLYFDGVEVTINKGSYSLNPVNKQTLNETEGGTLRRYIKRLGVPNISVNMPANDTEYSAIYSAYVSGQSMTVKWIQSGIFHLTLNRCKEQGCTQHQHSI